jgi:hypothetical protein
VKSIITKEIIVLVGECCSKKQPKHFDMKREHNTVQIYFIFLGRVPTDWIGKIRNKERKRKESNLNES